MNQQVMWAASVAGLVMGAMTARAQPTFELLPSDTPEAGWAIARGVSGDGQVVIGSGSQFSREKPAVWRRVAGVWTRFDLPIQDIWGRALAASHDGDTIAGMTDFFVGASIVAGTPARWTGVLSGSPVLTSPMDDSPTALYSGTYSGVSDDGALMTGSVRREGGPWLNELWSFSGGTLNRFSPVVEGISYHSAMLYGRSLSGDGTVVVGSWYKDRPPEQRTAFRWTAETGVVDLPTPTTGNKHSWADVISRDGAVIGGFLTVSAPSYNLGGQPVLWTSQGRIDLPLAPGAGTYGRVMGLSGDGSVATGAQHNNSFSMQSGGSDFPGTKAVIWLDGQVHELKTYLSDRGVDLLGVEPAWASGVSADGRVIVGFGSRAAEGDLVSFVVTLPALCPADLTGDGVVDFGDYLDFLNLYEVLDARVDFNDDGVIDFGDYLEFLNLYEAGC